MPRFARIPDGVRAVFFDAVGTLLHPEPSAPAAYHAAGLRHGCSADLATVQTRFAAAFRRQEQHDRKLGLRTDEAREWQRWRAIVDEVLPDARDPERALRELHAHFARPDAWRPDPDAGRVIDGLTAAGLVVGMASNFDERLRAVTAGLPELARVGPLVISSEVGWRKPAAEFFAAVHAAAGLPPECVLLVGDDPGNDHAGALAAGLHSLLLDPAGRSTVEPSARIRGLAELLTLAEGGSFA